MKPLYGITLLKGEFMEHDFTQKETCQIFCELSHQYLHGLVYQASKLSHIEVDKILADYTKPSQKKLNLNQMFEHFLGHAQNKANGGGAIRNALGSPWESGNEIANRWKTLKKYLQGLRPQYIKDKYPQRDYLENALLQLFQQKEFTGHVKKYITTMHRLALWFSEYNYAKEIYDLFDKHYKYESPEGGYVYTPEELHNHLRELRDGRHMKFYGMDVLLRDALKELGYDQFVKPDIHLKDIAIGIGIVPSNASNDVIAQSLQNVANLGGWTPYKLDKFLFLVGSGSFYKEGHKDIDDYFKSRDSMARKMSFMDFVNERASSPQITEGTDVALLRSQSDLLRGKRGNVISVNQKLWLVKVDFGGEELEVYISDLMVLH